MKNKPDNFGWRISSGCKFLEQCQLADGTIRFYSWFDIKTAGTTEETVAVFKLKAYKPPFDKFHNLIRLFV